MIIQKNFLEELKFEQGNLCSICLYIVTWYIVLHIVHPSISLAPVFRAWKLHRFSVVANRKLHARWIFILLFFLKKKEVLQQIFQALSTASKLQWSSFNINHDEHLGINRNREWRQLDSFTLNSKAFSLSFCIGKCSKLILWPRNCRAELSPCK